MTTSLRPISYPFILLTLVVLSACGDVEEPPPLLLEDDGVEGDFELSRHRVSNNVGDQVLLPLEVLGGPGYTVEVEVDVTGNPATVNRLFIEGHRLGFRDSSTNASRGTKGSVRINGGPWVRIDDDTARVREPARSIGGISGGYATVRLTVPIAGIVRGSNTLEFRLNRTDGVSLGYRVLAFNLLRDNANVLPESLFVEDDPSTWEPPMTSARDIAKGKRLWENATLVESPLSDRTLEASCADCHARNGEDLKYFNYSSWSIQARAEYHGIRPRKAKRIASYIRSLQTPAPEGARPWNPPYQPGPGLDDKPAHEWAAGAGLDAVLREDSEMLPYLFPEGTTRKKIARVIDVDGNLNVRELPISLQLPDWNAWLPLVHPKDIWTPAVFEASDANVGYVEARENLESVGVEALIDDGSLGDIFAQVNKGSRRFIATGQTEGKNSSWRVQSGTVIDSRAPRYTREQAKAGLAHWSAVKQWELAQEFDLASTAPEITAEEFRAWPGTNSTVFALAPHLLADDITDFEWETTAISKYHSTAWYQLQMTLNAGQRQVKVGLPMDWKYHFRHIIEFHTHTGIAEPLRLVASVLKGYQNMNNGVGPTRKGWKMQEVHPLWYYSDTREGDTAVIDALGVHSSSMRGKIIGALIDGFLDVSSLYPPADWDRCDGGGTACLEPANHSPALPERKFFAVPEDQHADNFWRLLPLLEEKGVRGKTRRELAEWCEAMWPQGDWESRL